MGCLVRACACTLRAKAFWKIAFTFTIPYIQGLWAILPNFDVSQTFHTFLWKRCETFSALSIRMNSWKTAYLQGFFARVWKWKQFFENLKLKKAIGDKYNGCTPGWGAAEYYRIRCKILYLRDCLYKSVEHQALLTRDGASLHVVLPWTHL